MQDLELRDILIKTYYEKRVQPGFKGLSPQDFSFEISDQEIIRITKQLVEKGFITADITNSINGHLLFRKQPQITSEGTDYVEIENQKKIMTNHIDTFAKSKIKIFISHSSKDKEFAEKFIDLLNNTIEGVCQDDIRCTSINGYKYKSGENFLNGIKVDSDSCQVVILLCSNNYIESGISMFEAGIAWFLDKAYPLIIDSKLDYKNLPTPISNVEVKKSYNNGELTEFLSDITERIGLKLKNHTIVLNKIENFIK